MTFQFEISQFYTNWTQTMEMNQNQTSSHGTYSNLTPCLSLSRNIKILQWLSKLKFNSFITKVNPNNGNKTKSDILPRDIFKSDNYSFFLSKVFQWLSKSTFRNFMAKVNLNNGNETKSDIFSWEIFKSVIIFISHKILKYDNGLYNWHFSISLQKWAQSSKVK